jgi:hypothetical protein
MSLFNLPDCRLLAGDSLHLPFPFPFLPLFAGRNAEQGDPRKNPSFLLATVSQLRLTSMTSQDILVMMLNCQAQNFSRSCFCNGFPWRGSSLCVRLFDMPCLLLPCAHLRLDYDDSAAL